MVLWSLDTATRAEGARMAVTTKVIKVQPIIRQPVGEMCGVYVGRGGGEGGGGGPHPLGPGDMATQ